MKSFQTRVIAMDVKEAVGCAKAYVNDLFGSEGIANLGLEELEYDDAREQWRITLGFSRGWDRDPQLSTFLQTSRLPRTYKIVSIDKDGKVSTVKNREVADAG